MHSSSHSGATGDNLTRLGVPSLDGLVHLLIGRGVADSTLKAYIFGKNRYMEFCDHFCLFPLPVSEVILLRVVAYLASLGLSYQTVKLYLSAVRHLQIMSNLPDPSVAPYPRLNYALRGLHRRRDSSPVFQLCWQCWLRFTGFGHNHHPRLIMSCCGQHFAWNFWIYALGRCYLFVYEGFCLGHAYATRCSGGGFSYSTISHRNPLEAQQGIVAIWVQQQQQLNWG